jgi:hypothetical protein
MEVKRRPQETMKSVRKGVCKIKMVSKARGEVGVMVMVMII